MENIDIRVRVSPELKQGAEFIFNEMGMTLSDAIRIFLKQSINSGGLPFRPHLDRISNIETQKAFKEIEDGDYDKLSLSEFKKHLGSNY